MFSVFNRKGSTIPSTSVISKRVLTVILHGFLQQGKPSFELYLKVLGEYLDELPHSGLLIHCQVDLQGHCATQVEDILVS